MRTTSIACLLALGGLGAFFACSTSGGTTMDMSPTNPPVSMSGGSASIGNAINQNPTGTVDMTGKPAPGGCGNGVLTQDEACDDGNRVSGDGCLENCLQVEVGYSCVPAGAPCHPIARCGDTVMVFPELCDDGNTKDGDGCSSGCKIEIGYKCDGQPSVCSHTTCGDNNKEGAESCEDGNALPFDGCSSDCQNEPQCNGGPCSSSCGDGIVMDEECDDGNNISGDGCSSDCKEEDGYTCTQPDLGDVMRVPMVVRDFNQGGDFEKSASFATGLYFANQGLLKSTLEGSKRKPALASTTGKYNGSTGKDSGIASAASFAQWYDETASASGNTFNKMIATKLNMYKTADGSAYVNRFGNNGDGQTSTQYRRTKTNYCGEVGKEDKDADGNAIPCTVCYYDQDPTTPQCDKPAGQAPDTSPCQTDSTYTGECVKNGTQWQGVFLVAAFDGNPLFFPADSITPASPSTTSQISGNYDDSWPNMPGNHNFSFTTEVRYWFQYDAKKKYQLRFVGDDDVWVFINGKLAVDLGGIHTAVQGDLTFGGSGGSVTVSATVKEAATGSPITAQVDLGLTSGQVYEVVVLQAERQTKASSYQLTLSGFSSMPSDCRPVCGDGKIGIGEECDDGANDGGYGECGPGCRLGEFCGDGVVQTGEDCDDGVNVGNPCPSGCRKLLLI